MLKIEKQEKIVKIVNDKKKISYEKLENLLGISESTIRRYCNDLEKKGYIVKILGGIAKKDNIIEESSLKQKLNENIREKRLISKYSSNLIENNDFIFLDAGTTIYFLIDYLNNKKDITVVTNGLTHIDKLMENNIKTIIVGGELKKLTKAVVGIETLNDIKKYNFTKSFIGANGIDIEFGVSTPDINEAMLKEEIIKNSIESYVLADDSKFDKKCNIKFAEISNVKIITNKVPKKYKKYKNIMEVMQ